MSSGETTDLDDASALALPPGDLPGAMASSIPMANWPTDLYIPPDALEIILEAFQGPLDLLLYLIRRQNLDILDIPVAEITHQYMKYVELMRRVRLDLAAEYLLMAATLAEIKSRLLIPRPAAEGEEEGEDPRAQLVRQLQEYERFRIAAEEIDQRPRMDRDIFVSIATFDDANPIKLEPQVDLDSLVRAFHNVIELAARNQTFNIGGEVLSLRERMSAVLTQLKKQNRLEFIELFDQQEGRLGLVVTFMALLELVRERVITLVQTAPYEPIHVTAVTAEGSTHVD